MKKFPKIQLAAMTGLLLVSEGFYISELAALWGSYPTLEAFLREEYLKVFNVIILPLIAWNFFRMVLKERHLIAEGEIAIGRVTGWWNGMKGFVLEFAFEDATGHTHRMKGVDMTGGKAKDMPVLVFYNATNAEESTAICGAFYEVCAAENEKRG